MDDVVWSDADAQRLKKLRLEAGMDVPELSRQSAVSAAQISQLEEGGDSLFYSPMIKYSVGKRLMLLLIQTKGVGSGPAPLIDEKIHSSTYLYSKELQAIEEMSRRNLDARPLSDALFWFKHQGQIFFQSKYVLASLAMLLAMAGISMYEKWDHQNMELGQTPTVSWLGEDSTLNLAWQKAKSSLAFESEQKAPSIAPQALSVTPAQTVMRTPVVMDTSKGVVPEQTSPQLTTPIAPVLEPIFNLQGAQASLTSEQEKWCRAELEQTPLTSVSNSKPANYIYIVALKGGQLCVKDGKNRMTWLELQAGQSQTLPGAAPWKLKSQDWSSFQLFFQGRRIPAPSSEVQQLALFAATQESIQAFLASQASSEGQSKP